MGRSTLVRSPPIGPNHGMALNDDGIDILTEGECRRLLTQARVGRVVIATGGIAVVFPVNYGVIGGDILFFTGDGTKMHAAAAGTTVTFEVDSIDVEQESGWSVLVVGEASIAEPRLKARAAAIGIYPWASGQRHRLVRVRPDVVTGRRIAGGRRPARAEPHAPLPTF